MNIKTLTTMLGLSLFVSVNLCAQPGPTQRRPSLAEIKTVLNEPAQQAIKTLFGSTLSEVTMNEVEVVEMGSPGWKYSPGLTNEIIYWPVKTKCAFTLTDEEGKSARQKLGILFRVTRDADGKCQAEFADLFEAGTLEERAAKLRQSRDSIRKAREVAQSNACRNNLRLLDAAKQQWALENAKPGSATPTLADLKEYLGRDQRMVVCPGGGTYTLGPVSTAPTCSIKGHTL